MNYLTTVRCKHCNQEIDRRSEQYKWRHVNAWSGENNIHCRSWNGMQWAIVDTVAEPAEPLVEVSTCHAMCESHNYKCEESHSGHDFGPKNFSSVNSAHR